VLAPERALLLIVPKLWELAPLGTHHRPPLLQRHAR
jgi:hypothetical protein